MELRSYQINFNKISVQTNIFYNVIIILIKILNDMGIYSCLYFYS